MEDNFFQPYQRIRLLAGKTYDQRLLKINSLPNWKYREIFDYGTCAGRPQTINRQPQFNRFSRYVTKKIRKFSISIEFWFQKPRISDRMSRRRISQWWKRYIGVPLYESWFQSWLCWWCFDHVFNHQNLWYFILEIIVFSRKL